MSDLTVELQSLHIHPVKSCAGVAVREALLIETGFELDRAWMLIDADGVFVTQRGWPRMALVQPTLKGSEMILRAPGMLALHIAYDAVEAATDATVWKQRVKAYDMGDLAARWFSDFLAHEVRLVRFDPAQQRLADARWTGAHRGEVAFQDGFPLLVASNASLDELNRRLADAGHAAVTMARFRPNLVLSGLEAHEEDAIDTIDFDADGGATLRLQLVKPCTRCPISDVDPITASTSHAVGDVLSSYRFDARLHGVTFGMNAIVLSGVEHLLRAGMTGRASYAFG